MDADRFAAVLRALAEEPSRRGILRVLGGGALAGLLGLADASARRKKRRGRKKKGGKRRKKPTCTDKRKNGHETDVDCGGSCPRCVNDKACATSNDCLSGRCLEGTCQPCTATAQCGVDPDFGECACEQSANGTSVCNPPGDQVEVASCAACPSNTNCFAGFGGFVCIAACRTA